MKKIIGSAVLVITIATSYSIAQLPDLPKELSGRWTWPARNASQTFSLEDIQRQNGDSFSAKLTWWTIDSKCAIRGIPITGKVTQTGLSFDATSMCNISFTVELDRAEKGWQGKGTTKGANPVVVEVKAN